MSWGVRERLCWPVACLGRSTGGNPFKHRVSVVQLRWGPAVLRVPTKTRQTQKGHAWLARLFVSLVCAAVSQLPAQLVRTLHMSMLSGKAGQLGQAWQQRHLRSWSTSCTYNLLPP
jgi:hypothetical protein